MKKKRNLKKKSALKIKKRKIGSKTQSQEEAYLNFSQTEKTLDFLAQWMIISQCFSSLPI